jgi:hypothetical protein
MPSNRKTLSLRAIASIAMLRCSRRWRAIADITYAVFKKSPIATT